MTEYYKSAGMQSLAKRLQYKVFRYSDIGCIPPEFHSDAEIIYAAKGDIEVRVDGRRFTLPENRFMLIMPDRLHEIIYGPCVDFWVKNFSPEEVPDFFSSAFAEKTSSAVFKCSSVAEGTFFNACLNPERLLAYRRVECLEKESVLDNLLYSEYHFALSRVLDCCIENGEVNNIRSEDEIFLDDMLEYISQVCLGHTSASLYARHLGVNEHNVRKRLKTVCRHIGYSYTYADFVYMCRVRKAAELLRSTDMYLYEIAQQCRFITDTRLRRFFIRFQGIRPMEYRKMYKELDSRNFSIEPRH